MVSQLSGRVEAAKTALAARRSESEQAKRDYARKAELAHSGTASVADVDKAHYAFDALDYQAQSLAGQLGAVQAQLDAAIRGVMIDAGGNDVAYSAQRADEVRLRLAELDRALDTAIADAEESASRLADETRRIDLLRSAKMAAPSAGMLWKVGSSNGERLGAGDMTAQLVDCGAAFLVASIPQNSYADVALGRRGAVPPVGRNGRAHRHDRIGDRGCEPDRRSQPGGGAGGPAQGDGDGAHRSTAIPQRRGGVPGGAHRTRPAAYGGTQLYGPGHGLVQRIF